MGRQAKLLGQHLQNVKFTVAFTSPYARALETSQIVLSESKVSAGLQLKETPSLREINCGIYENGASIKDIIKDYLGSGKEFCDWIPEKGETAEEIVERLEISLKEIFDLVDNCGDQPVTILAVSHGGFLHHLWRHLSRSPKYNFIGWKPEYHKLLKNCAYFKIEIEKRGKDSTVRELHLVEAHGREHLKSLVVDTLHRATLEDESYKKLQGCVQQ